MNKLETATNVKFVCSIEPKFGQLLVMLEHKGKTLQWLEEDRFIALESVFDILGRDETPNTPTEDNH